MRRPFGERQGIDDKLKLRELLRRLEMKVMLENQAGRGGAAALLAGAGKNRAGAAAATARRYSRRNPHGAALRA